MLKEIMLEAVNLNASDIHISANNKVILRISRKITEQERVVSDQDVLEMAKTLLGYRFEHFEEKKQMDMGGTIFGIRYRANIFMEKSSIAIAIRLIHNEIKSIVQLNLPYLLFEMVKKPQGLILITGPTGCGKSTTLAAMINEINNSMQKHIITLEDPIEYLFKNNKSFIRQREIGVDVNSYDDGLRSVLRQDPDIIMVGELRDKLAMTTALQASETGHLVLSTLHTANVKSTMNRIAGMYKGDEVEKARNLLADSLIAIFSQKLIRTADGHGVHPAFEILINTTATANLIRKGEVNQLDSYLMMDQKIGSLPMEKSIEQLIKKGIINKQDVE